MSKFNFLLLLFLFFALAFSPAFSQTGTISGKVQNERTGEFLPGATVELIALPEKPDSKKKGAISNQEAEFVIRGIQPGKYKFLIRYVGYKIFEEALTIKENDNITKNVKLIPDVIGLDEIVVTGVASRREKSISDVSVARINAEELQQLNTYQDLSQILSGKIPGVQVQTTSGNVGGGIRFQVRGGGGLNGDGQPVIYIDGTRIANDQVGVDISGQGASTLADLNPEDIASVEVLKGPAGAALYGTSGSNGVVLITTKRGKKGADYLNVNYSNNFGWNEQSVKYSENDFLSAKDANAIFREGGYYEHNMGFSGKSGLFSYYAGYTRRNEDGIVIGNKYGRESVRGNFEIVPSDEVSLKFSTNYVYSLNTRPINDNNVMGWLGNTMLFSQSYRFTDSAAIVNIDNSIETRRFIGSAEVNYIPKWLPGLKMHANIGMDALNYRNNVFYPTGYFYTGPGDIGEKEILSRIRDYTNYDLNISYSTNYTSDINGTTIVGAQLFNDYTSFSDVTMQGFATSRIKNMLSAADYISADDGLGQFKEAGIYLQEDLNIQEIYYLTLAIRNDYSSVIGISGDAPNIFYPRISGAVRLDKLGWNPDFMNFMKFRAGYGQSGQLPGLLSAYALRWAGSQSGYGVGAIISSIGNIKIEPERIQELEFGLEFEINNSYGMDFTYYMQFAEKSIVPFPNPPSSGLTASSVPKNLGKVNTWGFESQFYATPILTSEYMLNFNLILNYQDNEIVELGTDQPILGGFGNQGWYEGERRSAFLERKVTGAEFDPTTGEYVGPLSNEEIVYLGTPLPIITGSFTTTFKFLKHFTFSAMFDWATGHHVFNNTRAFQVSFGNDIEYNTLEAQLFGDGTNPPTLTPNTPEYIAAANKYAKLNPNYDANFIEEADWLRLRELALRVDLTEWMKSLIGDYFKTLSLAASVRNVALWTTYGGVDPEVNMFGSRDNVGRGVDFLTLQNARTFNFSVNLGL
jgi:TonB-dependent starch-binding outer membrane protein SusC